MQVIADTIKNAEAVLGELLSVTDATWVLCEAATPIQEWMRTTKVRKSPPVYVAETGKVMKENFIADFGAEYPTLSAGVMNGRLGSSSYRVNDALYKLGNCLKTMKERQFMIMSDEERKELHESLLDVVADFAIYTIIAFRLYKAGDGYCTLAASKACERRQVSPAIMYSEMLGLLERTGRTYYAYEPLSSMYADMLATEPAFLAECEEQGLPLTEDLARSLLEGETTVPLLMEALLSQAADTESTEVDVNPISMISRMNLT